jgi:rubrerythrin
METSQLKELLLQSLAHERGGVKVYETALQCAQQQELKEEWSKYHQQTQKHVQILGELCETLQIAASEKTPGVEIVEGLGAALVAAMQRALSAGEPDAAQLVACECVVLAETKDHLDWQLITSCAKSAKGPVAEALRAAADEVEEEEDEHLYHSRGWCRELWLKSLGLKAVLPPPEETQHVKSAIAAARAEKSAHPQ